jgi:hypothetical protein
LGTLKNVFNKARGEAKPETYPVRYVEDFGEPRTQLKTFFSVPAKSYSAYCGTGTFFVFGGGGGRKANSRENGFMMGSCVNR